VASPIRSEEAEILAVDREQPPLVDCWLIVGFSLVSKKRLAFLISPNSWLNHRIIRQQGCTIRVSRLNIVQTEYPGTVHLGFQTEYPGRFACFSDPNSWLNHRVFRQ
jgi:hypothetical protein